MTTLGINIRQVNSDFQAIKNKIVENGVEVANSAKTSEYADKVGKVYDAGMKAEYDEIWDALQNNGNRTDYTYCFGRSFNNTTFKPKYDLRPTGSAINMFYYLAIDGSLTDVLNEQGIILDTSKATAFNYLFQYASKITEIPHIDMSGVTATTTLQGVLYNCYSLVSAEMTFSPLQSFNTNCFHSCRELTNFVVHGEIAGNGFNISASTKLSHDSIISIINALSTTTSGLSVTLSRTAVNNAFETSEGAADGSSSAEWNALVGTKSNWTISLA